MLARATCIRWVLGGQVRGTPYGDRPAARADVDVEPDAEEEAAQRGRKVRRAEVGRDMLGVVGRGL